MDSTRAAERDSASGIRHGIDQGLHDILRPAALGKDPAVWTSIGLHSVLCKEAKDVVVRKAIEGRLEESRFTGKERFLNFCHRPGMRDIAFSSARDQQLDPGPGVPFEHGDRNTCVGTSPCRKESRASGANDEYFVRGARPFFKNLGKLGTTLKKKIF